MEVMMIDDDVVKAREELVRMGLLRDSGRRRNGEIVWEITDIGIVHAEAMIEGADEPKH
jgi:hypothetical protein